MVFIGAPFIEGAAIEFMRAMGSVIYVGIGALVLGAAPIIEWYTSLVSPSIDIWVGGTCEPEDEEEEGRFRQLGAPEGV